MLEADGMSATANVVVVEGIRTKSSWFVSDDGGPDCLGKRLAEYLLDSNNMCIDRFVSDNGMVALGGRRSAVWVYVVDFDNRSVELDGTVYDYHEFYARCCLDSVQLPYLFTDDWKDSFDDTPRTTLYNFELNTLKGLQSTRVSLCGAFLEPPVNRDSIDYLSRSFASLEKEEPVIKI